MVALEKRVAHGLVDRAALVWVEAQQLVQEVQHLVTATRRRASTIRNDMGKGIFKADAAAIVHRDSEPKAHLASRNRLLSAVGSVLGRLRR